MLGHRPALLGRTEVLAALTGVLADARDGHSATVVLSGEAGIGKTRLVEEISQLAVAAGDAVVVGRCWPVTGGTPPYGPVIDLLRELIDQQPGLPDEISAEVGGSLRALTEGADVSTMPTDPRLQLARLAASTVALLRAASTRRPLAAVIEDLHWTDDATVDVLSFWARKLAGYRITLIVTVRTEEMPRSSALGTALTELRRLPDTLQLDLPQLPDGTIAALLANLPTPPTDADRVIRLCQGNPFIALQLATQRTDGPVPPTLRDSLLAPVDALALPDRELLHVVAVLGDVTDVELVMAATGLSITELADALDRLAAVGLLAPTGRGISLRHALLRDVIVSDLRASERVLAHGSAARGLLATGADVVGDDAALLAYHLVEAGRQPEALRHMLRGARHAARRWAFGDAAALYATVRRLWRVVPNAGAVTGGPLVDILREHADALQWSGRLEEALVVLDQALALSAGSAAALLHHARGQVLWAKGLSAESLTEYETAAVALGAAVEDAVRAPVLASLAAGYMVTGQARKAMSVADEAIRVADAAGDEHQAVHAAISRAVAVGQLGELDGAAHALGGCVLRARALDDLSLINRAYGNLTFVLWEAGRFADCDRVATEGQSACRRCGPMLAVASTLVNNHIAALVALGRYDDAEELARQVLGETVPHGMSTSLHITLAGIAMTRGNDADMVAELASAEEISDQNPYTTYSAALVRAQAQLWRHRPDEAARLVDQVLPILRAQEDPLPLLDACRVGLRAAADLGRVDEALWRLVVATPAPSPAAAALRALCASEQARAACRDDAAKWQLLAKQEAQLGRPLQRAYALYRA